MFTAAAAPAAPGGASPGAITLPCTPHPEPGRAPGQRSQSQPPISSEGSGAPGLSSRGSARLHAPPLDPWVPGQSLRGGVPSAAGRAATVFPPGSFPRPWEGVPGPTPALSSPASCRAPPQGADPFPSTRGRRIPAASGDESGRNRPWRRRQRLRPPGGRWEAAAAAGGGRREGVRSRGGRGGGGWGAAKSPASRDRPEAGLPVLVLTLLS